MSAPDFIMKVSKNGQVSIPASARARWRAEKVVVVDLGDYLLMRPVSTDPVSELRGRYAGRGPSSEQMRRQAHEEEAARDERDPL